MSKSKHNKLEINKSLWDTQPNQVDETSILSNKNTFIQKIKKNNYPNKIYQPMKSNASVAKELKKVNLDKIKPLSRLGYLDYSVVDNIFEMHRPEGSPRPDQVKNRKDT